MSRCAHCQAPVATTEPSGYIVTTELLRLTAEVQRLREERARYRDLVSELVRALAEPEAARAVRSALARPRAVPAKRGAA